MTEDARAGGDVKTSETNSAPMYMQLAEADRNLLKRGATLTESLASRVSDLNAQLLELKERAEEQARQRKARTLSLGDVINKLDESGLPAPSRRRVANAYEAGSDLDAAIGQEMELVDELSRSLQPAGGSALGGSPYGTGTGPATPAPVTESGRGADNGVNDLSSVVSGLFGEAV